MFGFVKCGTSTSSTFLLLFLITEVMRWTVHSKPIRWPSGIERKPIRWPSGMERLLLDR